MLTREVKSEPYNKTAHRHALTDQLQHRSEGSIERKHQNISAVLITAGYPYISGYKPLGNYQRLLADVVLERLATDQELARLVGSAVSEPATLPQVDNILERIEPPPEGTPYSYIAARAAAAVRGNPRGPPVNYLELEARNSSLGRAGEEFIVAFERARLNHFGNAELADRVEHVAVTQGDGHGFDIHSFEQDGTDRLIEVKTTAYGKQTPFFVSRNEVTVSRIREQHYLLCRLFEFRDSPRLYSLKGSLEQVCKLEPIQFAARPR